MFVPLCVSVCVRGVKSGKEIRKRLGVVDWVWLSKQL